MEISGNAADAKVTGDAISSLKEDSANKLGTVKHDISTVVLDASNASLGNIFGVLGDTLTVETTGSYFHCDFVIPNNIEKIEITTYQSSNTNVGNYVFITNSENSIIASYLPATTVIGNMSVEITEIPIGAKYLWVKSFGSNRFTANVKETIISYVDIQSQLDSKVETNQGSSNSGKVLGIDKDGTVIPVEQSSGLTIEDVDREIDNRVGTASSETHIYTNATGATAPDISSAVVDLADETEGAWSGNVYGSETVSIQTSGSYKCYKWKVKPNTSYTVKTAVYKQNANVGDYVYFVDKSGNVIKSGIHAIGGDSGFDFYEESFSAKDIFGADYLLCKAWGSQTRISINMDTIETTIKTYKELIDSKVAIQQGINNSGKYLCVGSDGNVIPTDINKNLNPYYTNEYLTQEYNAINSQARVGKGYSFLFITDPHFLDNRCQSMYLVRKMLDNTVLPFALCGGDFVNAYINNAYHNEADSNCRKTMNILSDWRKYIGEERFFVVRGNHDITLKYKSGTDALNGTGVTYANSETYKYLFDVQNNWVTEYNSEHGCWYIDDAEQEIRIIGVNTSDNDMSTRSKNGHYVATRVMTAQIEWIINTALNCTNRKILFIGHIPIADNITYEESVSSNVLSASSNSLWAFSRLIDAINNKKTLDAYNGYSGNQYNTVRFPAVDFSKTTNIVVAYICGHNHVDEISNYNGTWVVSTCSDAGYEGDSGWKRTVGTVFEQAFDSVTLNFDDDNDKLLVFRRTGAGFDRTIHIDDVVSSTTLVPKTITPSTWVSSDESVVTVKNGVVTVVGTGKAIVTAYAAYSADDVSNYTSGIDAYRNMHIPADSEMWHIVFN